MSKCQLLGCIRKVRCKKLCALHYGRVMGGRLIGGVEPLYRSHSMDGLGGHPLKHTWENMLQRCNNPKNTNYCRYGARGIKVCERWFSFANFIADVGDKPTQKHTLDRKNNDGNYEPGNVRWATRREQFENSRPYLTNKLMEAK